MWYHRNARLYLCYLCCICEVSEWAAKVCWSAINSTGRNHPLYPHPADTKREFPGCPRLIPNFQIPFEGWGCRGWVEGNPMSWCCCWHCRYLFFSCFEFPGMCSVLISDCWVVRCFDDRVASKLYVPFLHTYAYTVIATFTPSRSLTHFHCTIFLSHTPGCHSQREHESNVSTLCA